MKTWSLAIVVLAWAVAPLGAQAPTRVITHPKIPSQETMDRLSLGFNWHARVPLTSPTDGLATVQVLPWSIGASQKIDIVAQTTSGWIYVFDGETGVLRWSTPVGLPGATIYDVAGNSQSIIVIRRDMFYLLDRENGVQRVYKKGTAGDRTYGVRLDAIPTAAPSALGEFVAFTFNDRVVAYLLPDFARLANARDKSPELIAQERVGSVQPLELWTQLDPTWRLNTPALVMPNQVIAATPAGRVYAMALGEARNRILFEFRTRGAIGAALNKHGDIGYIGGEDFNLYSVDFYSGRLYWRFASGAPILKKPELNNADVFVVSQGRGLFRVHRAFGYEYWLEPSADRFLAAHYVKDAQNQFKTDSRGRVLAKYVYASDRTNKLLIIDGDRGGVLANFDTSDWQLPVVNEWTDRLYLANFDGQILCVRPRDSRTPQVNRAIAAPAPVPDAKAPAAAPPLEPKKDEDKEKKDDKAAAERAPIVTPPFAVPEVGQISLSPLPRPAALMRNDRIMPSD